MTNNFRNCWVLLFSLWSAFAIAQGSIKGVVQDPASKATMVGVLVEIRGTDFYAQTNTSGAFKIENVPYGEYEVQFTVEGYADKIQSVNIADGMQDLGVIELRTSLKDENLGSEDLVPTIMLSDQELTDGASGTETVSGILNASRDIFSQKVAFAFGAARFRVRGYDSDNTQLLMNGIPMNDLESGRPTWWSWSGLNDVTRNRNSTIGLGLTDYAFGDIGGSSFIDSRASKQRKQFRVNYTFANRSYNHRLMATYNTGLMENGWAFSVSGSYRLTDNGPWTYIKGATYNGGAYFVGVEKVAGKHSFALNIMGSPSARGKGAPAVQEAFDLSGNNYYNPNWGYQTSAITGKQEVRNSRMTETHQPLFILTHEVEISDKTSLMTSASYQFGKYGSTALDWYNAQDPRPDYYRKLPSYLEDPTQAALVEEQWLADEANRQIQWDDLYEININSNDVVKDVDGIAGNDVTGRRSKYIVEERRYDSKKANFNTILNTSLSDNVELSGGLTYQYYNSHNFKVVDDLLGGDFYVDINRFVERDSGATGNTDASQNDLANPNRLLQVGDVFGYDYNSVVHKGTGWAQLNFIFKKLEFFASGQGMFTSFYREGNVQNGLFPESSLGRSDVEKFLNYAVKAGATYKLNGRNYLFVNGSHQTKAPYFRYAYVSPRVRNQVIDDLKSSKSYSIEGGYLLRSPKAKAKVVGYYSKFTDQFYQRSFYLDAVPGVENGGAFVNYIMQGIDKQHMGLELAGEYSFNNGFSISAAAAVGEYIYTSRPQATLYLDNAPENAIADRTIYLKDFYIPNTPQMAYNIGARYRSKKYWSLSINFNYTHKSFADVNPDRRTTTAVTYGENATYQEQAVEPGSALWQEILYQEELPGRFTCDLFFSKSWKINESFVYLNIAVSNVFNTTDLKTTGFEQFRFDYDGKEVSNFPTKYYHAYGTNFMVQLAFRL